LASTFLRAGKNAINCFVLLIPGSLPSIPFSLLRLRDTLQPIRE
jgi:hypothetical protein